MTASCKSLVRVACCFGLFVFGFFLLPHHGVGHSPTHATPAPKPKVTTPKYVFLISIDGWAFRHLWSKKFSLPHIRQLAKSGVWGDSRTVFPSMTWASHATIASGLYPRRHGVLGNRWFESHKHIMLPYWDNLEKRRSSARLYDLFHAAGMPTAAVMWPGTQGAKSIDFNLPELTKGWLIRRYVKGPMKRLILRSPRYSLRSMRRAMSREDASSDKLVTHVTSRLLAKPATKRPRLFMLHFLDLDHTQHHHSAKTNSDALQRSAKGIDAKVGELLDMVKKAGIYEQSTFFLVSDHGFLTVKRSIDARAILQRAGLCRRYTLTSRTAARERVVAFPNGHAAFIYIRGKKGTRHYKRLRKRVIKRFKAIREVESVMLPAAYASVGLPTPSQHKGSPDLIILAKPHAYFGYNSGGRLVSDSRAGAHGYLPNHPSMWVPFVASGAGIEHRRSQLSIHNVDIAPTIAHLMALEWPERPDGRVLHQILTPAAREAIAKVLRKRKAKRALIARAKEAKRKSAPQ